MSQTTLHPVAGHGVSDCLRHNKTHPSLLGWIPITHGHVDHDTRGTGTRTPPKRRSEITGTTQPTGSGQHYRDQADSSARPLRRRALRMARPARVRMRERKPCVRLRRRLLGWKVRLLMR